jgi:hypothetical protein
VAWLASPTAAARTVGPALARDSRASAQAGFRGFFLDTAGDARERTVRESVWEQVPRHRP